MKAFFTIVLLIIIVVATHGNFPNSNASQVKTPAIKQEPIEQGWISKRVAEEDQWNKEVLLIRALRGKMKNPASFKLEQALRMNDGTLCLSYRAANSFNAIILERAVINTKTTSASTEVTVWNKYCGGKTGTDISYIRQII